MPVQLKTPRLTRGWFFLCYVVKKDNCQIGNEYFLLLPNWQYIFSAMQNKIYTGDRQLRKAEGQMRLKEIRHNLGYSQKQVCEYIGCSGAVYSRYETGNREPSIDTLKRIAEFFEVSIDYLLENRDFEEKSLSKGETEMLHAYRIADRRAREDAYSILISHSAKG